MKVLVTGGAGFIGEHLVRRLLLEGCTVTVLDNFTSQVHGGAQDLAFDLTDHVHLFRGDVRDRELVCRAMHKQDVLVHLAAETGTGQSMYEVTRYEGTNIGGTATILDVLVNDKGNDLKKLVVASSRAVYGEGQYRCAEHGAVYPGPRNVDRMLAGKFDPICPVCQLECEPDATPEDCPKHPLSFYGLTKQVQEDMVAMFGQTRGIASYALRYQNVYGPGQSLTNPYTGILAIFSALARSNSPIQIFEDGRESRDFIFIDDVVEATWRFISELRDLSGVYNVGTGQRTTVLQVANEIVRCVGGNAPLSVTGAFRQGDIRHNFADLSKTRDAIGFRPLLEFSEGLGKFVHWAAQQGGYHQSSVYRSSLREMAERGLLHE